VTKIGGTAEGSAPPAAKIHPGEARIAVHPNETGKSAMQTHTYDAIVIGAGQAGGPLSTELAKAGRKTAIVERQHVGGTCINEGCTPTKTMIASARIAYLAHRAAEYGVLTGPVSVDLEVVRQRKRDIVASWSAGSQRRIEETPGVDLLFGEARFTGPQTLQVRLQDGEIREIFSSIILINTGDRPSRPAIPGADTITVLDSTSIMELGRVPEHLLIVGGGYIGLEFGQMFRRFGSKVTIVQRGSQLLSREDADVAEEVAKILREDGIEIWLKTKPTRAAHTAGATGENTIELAIETDEDEQVILRGSHLLVATGRTPNTDWLDPAAAGIAVDATGHIIVNDRLETSVPGIYAMGDVKGGPAFTHISYDDFRIVRANLLEHHAATIAGRLVPYTVFIDPQLGRVGMSEQEARRAGLPIRVAKLPMSSVARAVETNETRGFMKAIVHAETGQILGAAVLGIEGGEIMSVLEVAMMGKLPYSVLREGVFAHPTLTESLNNLFMTLDGE
jgi:pyruvate/2-oxoglutarate dehydrogenase complex dihydrolipoamide dehydrogenase (E3) component